MAVEAREHTAVDLIWKFDKDTLFVCLCKLTPENKLNDCMVQLPPAVCDNLRWGRNSKFLDICISKMIRELNKIHLQFKLQIVSGILAYL